MGMEGVCVGWEKKRAVKITKSFLFKYAVITGNAEWCSWVCMCFDSVDILCTVTVSLLANYHGKATGQVTAGSLKEIGDWTYAEDAAGWHSPASLWRVTSYMTWLFVSRELGESVPRDPVMSCCCEHQPLHHTVSLRFPLWGLVWIHKRTVDKALRQKGLR